MSSKAQLNNCLKRMKNQNERLTKQLKNLTNELSNADIQVGVLKQELCLLKERKRPTFFQRFLKNLYT